MDIQKMVDAELQKGYSGDNALAKVCQDIVLKAIANSSLNRNVTIKGGVVMRSKTNNVRRATQDLDIDFIRYPLTDTAIDSFLEKLNCLNGIKIGKIGNIEELKQQDYKGRRVHVQIEDENGFKIQSKIDLGVHNRLEIEQEEYCFDIAYDNEGASLLINSNEQMFAEKLRSLLRFGPLSTRVKDVFDLYYLKDYIDMGKLQVALNEYIFHDEKMRENQGSDIVRRLTRTFKDKDYVSYLEKSDKRWIDEDISVVLNGLLEFANRI